MPEPQSTAAYLPRGERPLCGSCGTGLVLTVTDGRGPCRRCGIDTRYTYPDPAYRIGRKLGTTIYRIGHSQPCAWVPDDPALAGRIVDLLNAELSAPSVPPDEAA
jgi:hypothetical protein